MKITDIKYNEQLNLVQVSVDIFPKSSFTFSLDVVNSKSDLLNLIKARVKPKVSDDKFVSLDLKSLKGVDI